MTKNWNKKKNVDLWIKLDEIITSDINITWKHVKGHSGNKWNDYCDMLAVHGSELILNIIENEN
jgi:ribonuclease HI